MADHQQRHDSQNEEQNSGPQNQWSSDTRDSPPNNVLQQTTIYDDLHGLVARYDMVPPSYNDLSFTETYASNHDTFLQAQFQGHPNFAMSAGPQPIDMHAPATFVGQQVPESAWVDEFHPSYTPAPNGFFEWTSPNLSSYGWGLGIPSSHGQRPSYEDSPTMAQPFQYNAMANVLPYAYTAQRYVPEILPRAPLQDSSVEVSTSVAIRGRKDKVKKEFATSTYEIVDPNGHRPLRISKTKKLPKPDNATKQEACWRCKRYRKACIGKDVCKECSTAGFRVWPSAIGCRRGAMEGFVEKLMPLHSVEVLRTLRGEVLRTSNWRKALTQPDNVPLSPGGTSAAERWELVKIKVQSTMMFGADFSALVNILAAYENSHETKIPIWTESVTLLSSTCDFYHFFVASSNAEVQHPNLINATIKFRKSLLRSWDLFLKLSLSGKRENWFPAFLSVVLGICSMVIFMDAVAAVPISTRNAIWGDVEAVIKDLRVRQHMMSLELLKIGAKGINPLRLDYWVADEETTEEGQKIQKRNPKGMALLGGDSAAFDGFIALKTWHSRYKSVMREGSVMWDSVPYTATHVQAIAALSRVFEF